MKPSAPIIATTRGADFDLVPEGVHNAVCYCVYDIGTHISPAFGSMQRKVMLGFEFPELPPIKIDNEDCPRALIMRHTRSLSEKANLRQVLQAWRGRSFTEEELKGFDLMKVIGVKATVQVIHQVRKDGGKKANINAVLPGRKDAPGGKLEKVSFSVDQLENAAELDASNLPEWIVKIVKESEEYKELTFKKVAESAAAPFVAPSTTTQISDQPEPDNSDDVPF